MISIDFAKEVGQDLSGRGTAAELRERIVGIAEHGAPVTLDFSHVRTLSDSFADELFGVLVLERGENWFREYLKFDGLSVDVRLTILGAVQSRIERQQENEATCN